MTVERDPAGAGGLFPDSRPDIPTDDWDDQDLLTKDEATLRLEHSLRLFEGQLAQARAAGEDGAADELEAQIGRIKRVLDNIKTPR